MVSRIGRIKVAVFSVPMLAIAVTPVAVFAQQDCSSIASMSLSGTTIVSAKLVPAGPFSADPDWMGPVCTFDLPEFCRVSWDPEANGRFRNQF